MPVLGESSRRRRRTSATPWVLLAAALTAGGVGWRWRAQRKRRAAAAAAAAQATAAPVAAPAEAPQPVASPPAAPASGPRQLSVVVDGALETALDRAVGGETGPALTQVVKRVLVWWLRVPGELQKGDRVELLYEERPNEEPAVLALRLVSGRLHRTFEAFRFQGSSTTSPRYYLPDGEELELRLEPSPLDDYEQVTSLIRDGRGHKGVDFKTPEGTPVKATFDGTVTRRNWAFYANGNSLEVTESAPPHRRAMFLHLSPLPKTLTRGTSVQKGQVLAFSGNSGHSFAPHLHYQLESEDGRVLDPFQEHATRRATLPASDRTAFDAWVAQVRQQFSAPAAEGSPRSNP